MLLMIWGLHATVGLGSRGGIWSYSSSCTKPVICWSKKNRLKVGAPVLSRHGRFIALKEAPRNA